jgi:signal transduction histidine kinase
VLRRRRPLPVLAVTLAAALTLQLLYDSFQIAGALVALYSVAAHVGRPNSVRAAAATAVAVVVAATSARDPVFAVVVSALFATAWLLGDNVRTRRAYLRELEQRAARLEREREEHARRAAAEEQARIARELHDILTHSVSVMTVQAAAAGDVFETQPGQAHEALKAIESTGREALTELRRLLGRVRSDDGDAGRFAPQPGLAQLDALIDQVRATGLAVELKVAGTPRELPAAIDVSAYRIVQEALTNTLKHARAANVEVVVRYEGDAVELEVVDDGMAQVAGAEAGRGIIGMRERAAVLGGELEAGPRTGGGFAVGARFPVEVAP